MVVVVVVVDVAVVVVVVVVAIITLKLLLRTVKPKKQVLCFLKKIDKAKPGPKKTRNCESDEKRVACV